MKCHRFLNNCRKQLSSKVQIGTLICVVLTQKIGLETVILHFTKNLIANLLKISCRRLKGFKD